jgi:hypothetical protein
MSCKLNFSVITGYRSTFPQKAKSSFVYCSLVRSLYMYKQIQLYEFYRKTLRIFNINAFTFFAQFVHSSVLILPTPSALLFISLKRGATRAGGGSGAGLCGNLAAAGGSSTHGTNLHPPSYLSGRG